MQNIQPQTQSANIKSAAPVQPAPGFGVRPPALSGSGKAANKKKQMEDPRTPELTFAEEIKSNPDMARRGEVLYRWKDSHYEPINVQDGERGAMQWLANHIPDRATPNTAKACFAAACMLARKMPDTPAGLVVIPLLNAYLLLQDDGTIERVDPQPSYGMTYALNVTLTGELTKYVPQPVPAGSRFDHYLSTSLPDAAVRAYVQEMVGDTLTPSIRFQRALLLKGKGRNGKSILSRLLAALHHKVAPMQLNALTGFALAPLIGASLAVVDEVPKSGINEQMVKSIISGEELTIDLKHRDPVRYRPTAKWVISTNNDQKTSDNSDGFWRRLSIIPFTRQIPEAEVIPCLDELIIQHELHYFLDWCLLGLCRLNARGKLPPEPEAVKAAKREAVEASNSVIAWVNDQEVRIVSEVVNLKEDVYEHYKVWCDTNRLRALSGGQFWKAMLDAIPDIKDKQRRVSTGGERKRFVNLAFGWPDEDEPHPFG
jgi:putative DNA primase/helicase